MICMYDITPNLTQGEAGKKGESDPPALAVSDVSFPGMAREVLMVEAGETGDDDTYIYIYICVCVCVCMYIYTYMYVCIYI